MKILSLQSTITIFRVGRHTVTGEALTFLLEESLGFSVVGEAETIAASLPLIKRLSPRVVISGPSLPDGSAAELARALVREKCQTTSLLVTVREREPNDSLMLELLQAPIGGLLLVPETDSELLTLAIKAVGRGILVVGPGLKALVAGVAQEAGGTKRPPENLHLSAREEQVLKLMMDGLTNREIADRLSLSIRTVQYYGSHLLAKLGAHSRIEAVLMARQAPWRSPSRGKQDALAE